MGKGRVRCTWFEGGRRCTFPPVEPHYNDAQQLVAFLCMPHQYELEKAMKAGTFEQIQAALTKAHGRKK